MEKKAIRIECAGAETVKVEEIKELQAKTKHIKRSDIRYLKNSILKLGFSEPISIWKDRKGIRHILNGHSRKIALLELKEEGWKIPPLPAATIKAKNLKEAKIKLVAIGVSKIGKVDRKGFEQFLLDSAISLDEIRDLAKIPDIRFDTLLSVKREEPEVEFSQELMESHNYVVLYFDNDMDWLQCQTVLDLKPVRSKHLKLKQVGIGRVLKGRPIIERIRK